MCALTSNYRNKRELFLLQSSVARTRWLAGRVRIGAKTDAAWMDCCLIISSGGPYGTWRWTERGHRRRRAKRGTKLSLQRIVAKSKETRVLKDVKSRGKFTEHDYRQKFIIDSIQDVLNRRGMCMGATDCARACKTTVEHGRDEAKTMCE